MSRDLVLDVVARKNSRDLSTLADEFDRLAKETDDAGRRMHSTGTFSQFLDAELVKTKQHVQELGKEFEATGDKDVFAKLRGAQSNVSSLERIKKDLSKALDDGAKEAESGVSSSLKDALSNVSPLMAGGIAAGVALAGPILLGAAGLGGIGLGIAGQIHSPAVQRAFAELGSDATNTLHLVTSSFEDVLVSSAGKLDQSFSKIAPNLTSGVDALAPTLDHLVDGVTGMVEKMTPGFVEGMKGGAVVLDQVAKDLPGIGATLGETFDTLAQDARGGADGVHQILEGTQALITVVGVVADQFERLDEIGQKLTFGHLADFTIGPFAQEMAKGDISASKMSDTVSELVFGPLTSMALKGKDAADVTEDFAGKMRQAEAEADGMATAVDLAGGKAMSASDQYGRLTAQLGQLNNTQDTVAGAMADKLFGALMGADEATLHFAEAQTKLSEELKKNKDSLDIHSKAGDADRNAILGAVQANIAIYDQNIKSGMAAQEAATAYDANTKALEKQMRQAGLTQKQIDGLIGKYKDVPDKVDTNIALDGLTKAIEDLDDLLRKINGIPKNITIQEHVYTYQDPGQTFHGLAHGGRADVPGYAFGGGVIKVGEVGPEYLSIPPSAGPAYITPNSAINGAANGGGGDVQTLRVILEWPDGTVIRDRLVNFGRRRGYRTVDALLPVSSAK